MPKETKLTFRIGSTAAFKSLNPKSSLAIVRNGRSPFEYSLISQRCQLQF